MKKKKLCGYSLAGKLNLSKGIFWYTPEYYVK